MPSFSNRIVPAVLIFVSGISGALAQAQKYPVKPIRLMVGFNTGSSTDVVARILVDGLSQRLGQPVIVENRPGASATIAANLVAKAAPDGYTMVIGSPSAHATAPYAFLNLPYDPIKDFAPVALVGNTYYILAVSSQLGVKTVKEFVALAKSKPGQFNYASVGEGSLSHLGGLIFSDMTGTQFTHVPYKGSSQSVLDVVAGRVQFLFTSISTTQALHRDGKLRIIAVAGPRQAVLPDVPTMAEAGLPDYKLYFWLATFMPAGTPGDIVSRVNRDTNAVVESEKTSKLLNDAGFLPETLTPEGLGALIRKDAETFRQIVIKAGIKPQPL
ncbi:MAG: tripartite tricarboxylate transporter substrate binding protein [Betaproteobacteria bacterium]|nr:tripartite tricarboxylate transporter substrate binding protein [Betaproteobacteria bacterium]